MKYFVHYLKSFWFYLFGNKIDKLNLKLEKAAIDSTRNRYNLKKEISNQLNKAFGISFSKRSKYIPVKGHNRQLIYNYVNKHFSKEMLQNNITLTKCLNWK
jgi:hypothetical protein